MTLWSRNYLATGWGRWYQASGVEQPAPHIGKKQIEAVRQYAFPLFLAAKLTGLLMESGVHKGTFRHVLELMRQRGAANTAITCLQVAKPIPSHARFTDTWKNLAKSLELGPPVSVANPPTSGRSWPL